MISPAATLALDPAHPLCPALPALPGMDVGAGHGVAGPDHAGTAVHGGDDRAAHLVAGQA